MVNSVSANIPNTNITASPKINEEKPEKIENESKETKPQEVTLDKLKSFTNNQRNIGVATIGLGALAAAGVLVKNKALKGVMMLPAAIVTSMVGYEMYSGALKADATINSIQNGPHAKSLDTNA